MFLFSFLFCFPSVFSSYSVFSFIFTQTSTPGHTHYTPQVPTVRPPVLGEVTHQRTHALTALVPPPRYTPTHSLVMSVRTSPVNEVSRAAGNVNQNHNYLPVRSAVVVALHATQVNRQKERNGYECSRVFLFVIFWHCSLRV